MRCVCARSRLRACARSHLRVCARLFSCACALAHSCALARPLRGIFTCTYAPTDPRPRATRPARRPRLKAERLANATARARLLRTRLLFCYHILNLVAKLVSRFQLGKLLWAVAPPPPPLLLQLGRLGLQQVPCEQELAAVQQLGVVHLHRGLRSTATVYIINKQATTSYPYPYCICGRLPGFLFLRLRIKSQHHLVIDF